MPLLCAARKYDSISDVAGVDVSVRPKKRALRFFPKADSRTFFVPAIALNSKVGMSSLLFLLLIFLGFAAVPVLIVLGVKKATEPSVGDEVKVTCPLVLSGSVNAVEITNPTRSSRILISLGLALLLPNILFCYFSAGIGFYMMPLGLLGLILIVISLRSKDVLKTVIAPSTRSVTFIYSPSVFSSKSREQTIPFAQLSMIMVEFRRPSNSARLNSPGGVSVTLMGKSDYVEIFSFQFTQKMLEAAKAFMPELRQRATEVGRIMSLKVILDIPPQSSNPTASAT